MEAVPNLLRQINMSRQLSGLMIPMLERLLKKSSDRLSEDDAHTLRLMHALQVSLDAHGTLVTYDVDRKYICPDCGHQFEVPVKHDLSSQKGYDYRNACPNCDSSNYREQPANLTASL